MALSLTLSAASGPDKAPVPPGQGSISASGKFTPAPNTPPSSGPAAQGTAEWQAALKLAAKLQPTGSNTLRVGAVELDKQERAVTLAARMTVRTQVVEYALVTERGKAYESMFTTPAAPVDVHLAFLLLGVSPVAVTGEFGQPGLVPATNGLDIEVTWETNNQPVSYHLAELLSLGEPGTNQPTRSMAVERWLYNGSTFDGYGFAAQREGSIISVIRDASALVNNPAADRDNDRIHLPKQASLPPEGWPVRIVMRLPKPPKVPAEPLPPWVSPITPLRTNR